MDFVLVVRGYIDVAARVWLEVGWGGDLHLWNQTASGFHNQIAYPGFYSRWRTYIHIIALFLLVCACVYVLV